MEQLKFFREHHHSSFGIGGVIYLSWYGVDDDLESEVVNVCFGKYEKLFPDVDLGQDFGGWPVFCADDSQVTCLRES